MYGFTYILVLLFMHYNGTSMQPNSPKKPSSFDVRPINQPGHHSASPQKPANEQFHQPPATLHSLPTTHQQHTPQTTNMYATHGPSATTLKDRRQQRREELKSVIYTILFFGSAIALPVLMILFIFQSYVVDGSSMQPTLQNNNRVFILKLPKTLASIRNTTYIPERNEIIVFKKPSNDNTQLIKRVIGLPGDRVVIENGIITVYNIDNPEGFNPDTGTDHENTLQPVDTGGAIVTEDVGENELFVMGDNRGPGGSLDSHSGLGLVPVENIVGRLWIRYFPVSEFTVFATTFANNVTVNHIAAAMNTPR